MFDLKFMMKCSITKLKCTVALKKAFSTAQPLLKMMPQTCALFSTSANALLECTIFWNHWQEYMSIPHCSYYTMAKATGTETNQSVENPIFYGNV